MQKINPSFIFLVVFGLSWGSWAASLKPSDVHTIDIVAKSCPDQPLSPVSLDEFHLLVDIERQAAEHCEEHQSPKVLSVSLGSHNTTWGGNNPLCGLYRWTNTQVSFNCI